MRKEAMKKYNLHAERIGESIIDYVIENTI